MKPSNLALVFVYALLVVFAAITLIPFAWMLASSLKGSADFFESMFLPRGDGFLGIAWDRLTLDNYTRLFAEHKVARALLYSVFLSSVTSLPATLCAAMGGTR
jgi:multiple sugar transport system permease protein